MIKFFRNTRKKLLAENRFNKYLLYAIGEIILVVIGILIALQINNWNENNKLKTQEKEILNSLKEEISNNNEVLQKVIKENKYINKTSAKVLDSINVGVLVYEKQNILLTTVHNPKSFDISVLINILNNPDVLITNKELLISKLRTQRFLYESVKKDLFYIDENWNNHLTKFIIECGFDLRNDTKNGPKISLKELKKCGFPKNKLKPLVSLTYELRATWVQNSEAMLKHSEELLKELSALDI